MAKEYKVFNRVKELLAIKERAERRNISQRQMSEETGVDRRTIGMWIRNEETARYDEVLGAFCEYFDVGIGEILYLEINEESPDDEPGQEETPLAATA